MCCEGLPRVELTGRQSKAPSLADSQSPPCGFGEGWLLSGHLLANLGGVTLQKGSGQALRMEELVRLPELRAEILRWVRSQPRR